MDTPKKEELAKGVDDLTPGTRDESYYNFWEERKARVVKRLKLDMEEDDDENKYLKVSEVQLKRYHLEKMSVRITFVGRPGVTNNGDPVLTFFGMDETGEIAFTTYRNNVKKAMEIAKVGKVVEIQGFYVEKEKEGRFSRTRAGSDKRLTLVDASTIVASESTSIPEIPYNFASLSDLDNRAMDELVDIRGIIVRVSDIKYDSRDVFVTDGEDNTVKVSLYKDWKDSVKLEDLHKCLVLRRAFVRESPIGRKFLRADWNTLVQVDPNLSEVQELKEWFESRLESTMD